MYFGKRDISGKLAGRNTRATWPVPLAWNLRCELLNTAMAVWLDERSGLRALLSSRGPMLRSHSLSKSSQGSGKSMKLSTSGLLPDPEQGRDKMTGRKNVHRWNLLRSCIHWITPFILLQQFLDMCNQIITFTAISWWFCLHQNHSQSSWFAIRRLYQSTVLDSVHLLTWLNKRMKKKPQFDSFLKRLCFPLNVLATKGTEL